MKKISYYFSLIPFQLNFFVVGFVLLCTYFLIQNEYLASVEKTYFVLLVQTLALFVYVFSLLILGLAFTTALFSWIYFILYKRTRKESPVTATIGEGNTAEAGYLPLGLKTTGIIKPLLGHVKGRIVFSDTKISPSITLDQPVFKKNSVIREGLVAGRPVWIPDIKEHEVKKIVLYFEDLFRLFSFPYVLSNVQKLLTIPALSEKVKEEINPNQSIEQEQRIETPKRIQGELFNYKHFESGDDIRRIVWKIYAKNKELVVKIPETMDPYASHLYFQPSFYTETKIGDDFKRAMLNYYKVRIRQLYEALQGSEFAVKYKADQEATYTGASSEETPEWLIQLSTSVWHRNQETLAPITSKKEGIYCFSSLISVDELKLVLDNKAPDTLVFFVPLSSMLKNRTVFNLATLFVKMEEHPLTKLKRRWLFSSSKSKLISNEKAIQSYLEGQLFKHRIVW